MIDYCKYCKSTDLELIENYEYQFEEEPIEIITILKCNICTCIHKIVDNELEFYEFSAREVMEHNKSGDWKI